MTWPDWIRWTYWEVLQASVRHGGKEFDDTRPLAAVLARACEIDYPKVDTHTLVIDGLDRGSHTRLSRRR